MTASEWTEWVETTVDEEPDPPSTTPGRALLLGVG